MSGKFVLLVIVGFLYGLTAGAEQASGTKGRVRQHRQQQKQERVGHIKEQKQENAAFRQTLKGSTPKERKAAVIDHRKTQGQENKAFNQKQHDENMTFLKKRLANNKKLTNVQKDELVNFFEQQYQQGVDLRSTQQQENVTVFQSIANNPSLNHAQKKQAIRDHFKEQKGENKAFVQEQKSENQAERAKIKSEVESSSGTK